MLEVEPEIVPEVAHDIVLEVAPAVGVVAVVEAVVSVVEQVVSVVEQMVSVVEQVCLMLVFFSLIHIKQHPHFFDLKDYRVLLSAYPHNNLVAPVVVCDVPHGID